MSICLVKQNDRTWVEKHRLYSTFTNFFFFVTFLTFFFIFFWNVFTSMVRIEFYLLRLSRNSSANSGHGTKMLDVSSRYLLYRPLYYLLYYIPLEKSNT